MIDGSHVRATTLARADADIVPLRRYGNFLRRNRVAVALTLLAVASLSVLRLVTDHPVYTSTVSVLTPAVPLHTDLGVTPSAAPSPGGQPPSETTMDTEAQLAQSDRVLGAVAKVPGFRIGRDRLKKRVSITVPPYTRVLSISVTAYSPTRARDGARALVKNYLAVRKQVMAGIQARKQQALEQTLALLKAQLRAVTRSSNGTARLTPHGRVEELTTRIVAVRGEIGLNADKTPQSGQVILSASLPRHSDAKGFDVTVSTGCGLGLLGGLLFGLAQDRRPRRIRSFTDVRRAVSLPVIAEVAGDADALREAGRKLRNVIHQEDAEVVLLTAVSGSPTENLAHALLAVLTEAGMSAALLRVGASDTGRRAALPPSTSVFTVPTGGDGQLSAAVRRARRDADLVVVTGPALHSPDAVILATICDLTFVVVALSRISVDELAAGANHLAHAAAPARGLVLTRRDKGAARRAVRPGDEHRTPP